MLRALQEHLDCKVFLRGNLAHLRRGEDERHAGERVVRELSELIARGHEIGAGHDRRGDRGAGRARIARAGARGRRLAPPRPARRAEERQPEALRRHDPQNTITFGDRPRRHRQDLPRGRAGRPRAARPQVNRIILTRPGGRGRRAARLPPRRLMAKVDPYLRPLFDALHDMLEPETVAAADVERGAIEVAPLAFMRGRAQPARPSVLTPAAGGRSATLRVGDLVIGSDGRPTPCSASTRRARRTSIRVTTRTAPSTLCCGEHCGRSTTPDDRAARQAGRVLRRGDGRRCAAITAPVRTAAAAAPVEFRPRACRMDPYALGLLLGDGCITGSTTPAFDTTTPSSPGARGRVCRGIELPAKGVDYVLDTSTVAAAGVIVANPVTAILRELGLGGTQLEHEVRPEDVPAQLPRGSARGPAGPARHRRRPGDPGGPDLPDPVHDTLAAAPRRRRVPRALARRRRLLPHAAGRGPHAGPGEGTRRPPPLGRLHPRHPSPGGRRAVPARSASARRIASRAAAARCASSTASNRPARRRRCASRSPPPTRCTSPTTSSLTHNTLNDSFIILDEAQNTTPEQMKMFLTRLGLRLAGWSSPATSRRSTCRATSGRA